MQIEYPDSSCYCRYPRQTEPQDVFVELNPETETLRADYDSEIGGAVPEGVWHGRVLRWLVPNALKPQAWVDLLDSIVPLAQRVCDGFSTRWDGNNHVGVLDADAETASEEIDRVCAATAEDDSAAWSVWQADELIGGIGSSNAQRSVLGISGATTDTDEELARIAERLEAEAASDDIDEIEGLGEYVEELRDEAQEEDEEASER